MGVTLVLFDTKSTGREPFAVPPAWFSGRLSACRCRVPALRQAQPHTSPATDARNCCSERTAAP